MTVCIKRTCSVYSYKHIPLDYTYCIYDYVHVCMCSKYSICVRMRYTHCTGSIIFLYISLFSVQPHASKCQRGLSSSQAFIGLTMLRLREPIATVTTPCTRPSDCVMVLQHCRTCSQLFPRNSKHRCYK